jgi:hypothetical protein
MVFITYAPRGGAFMRFNGAHAPERKGYMNTTDKIINAPVQVQEAEQPDLVKRIGKTTYRVKVHFNPTARETMSDKIIRLLRNEVQQSPNL